MGLETGHDLEKVAREREREMKKRGKVPTFITGAIIITAVIFSFIHMQFLKALPMFFLAIVFGYAVYWTRTIWTAILAHFINNTLAVAQLYYFTDGNYDEALSLENTMPIYVTILLAGVVISLFVYIQKNSNTKTENFYV